MFAVTFVFFVLLIAAFFIFMVLAAKDREPGVAMFFGAGLIVFSVLATLLVILATNQVVLGGSNFAALKDQTVNIAAGQDFKFQPDNGFYYIDSASTTGLTVCNGNGCSGVSVGPDAGYQFVLEDTNDTVVISPSQNATLNLIY